MQKNERRTFMESIFFYNANTGEAAIGIVKDNEFSAKRTYPIDAFARGWANISEIPLSGGNLLFYRASDRSGAIGKLVLYPMNFW
jgi:hypothetical protein